MSQYDTASTAPPDSGFSLDSDFSPESASSAGSGSGADSGSSKVAATAGTARDEAASLGQTAAQSGQQVASVAKDQVTAVASETTRQAKDLLTQAHSELSAQAASQQDRVASGLRALGDELHSMTQHDGESGVATDLARQAAGRTHDVAQWLESRDPGTLLSELQDFARRRPGTFLLAAAGAGLLAGRLTRGIVAGPPDEATSTAAAPSAQIPAVQEPVRPFASSDYVPANADGVIGGLSTAPEFPSPYEQRPMDGIR
jgi:hypothetical protein